MDFRSLGKGGPKVSAIGLGAWQWGSRGYWRYGDRYSRAELVAILDEARACGINLIDTAEVYGRGESERLLGELAQEDGFLMATKFLPLALGPGAVERHLDRSLRRLRRRSVDLYQVHFHNPLLSLRGTMKCLERMVAQGKVGHIGVSNFDLATLQRAREFLSTTDIVSNQVRFNLLHRRPERNGMLDYCRREGLAVIAWSPLEQGALTGKYLPGAKVRGWRRVNRHLRAGGLRKARPLLEELERASRAHGREAPQGALAWVLRHEGVIAIPGASRPEQVRSNAGGAGWGFTPEELDRLDRAAARLGR